MMSRILATVSAAALSVAVIATAPAMAQSQLRQTVTNQLAEHSIEVPNLNAMSNSELAQIELILNTTEGSSAQKQAMVDQLLAEQAPCEGNPMLRQNVANQLKEHGITIGNFDNVSGSELVVVKTVLDGSGSSATKRSQIERIFAEKAPISDSAYLREDAAQCIDMVGADLDVDDLTPGQMLQIQAVAGSNDDIAVKRQMIENIGRQ
jgi:hypothetical protein